MLMLSQSQVNVAELQPNQIRNGPGSMVIWLWLTTMGESDHSIPLAILYRRCIATHSSRICIWLGQNKSAYLNRRIQPPSEQVQFSYNIFLYICFGTLLYSFLKFFRLHHKQNYLICILEFFVSLAWLCFIITCCCCRCIVFHISLINNLLYIFCVLLDSQKQKGVQKN